MQKRQQSFHASLVVGGSRGGAGDRKLPQISGPDLIAKSGTTVYPNSPFVRDGRTKRGKLDVDLGQGAEGRRMQE